MSLARFLDRGIVLHQPGTIMLEVEPGQLATGVEIFPGCRISGNQTSIGPGCRIGEEAPATLINCQLGQRVRFAGGCAEGATFLDGVCIGAGAHIRAGTLLEEHASCAHTVGLKQTLLMPWVTLGSLINFCDCLMAGGTGPQDHSEVGSSYVHFNFTPHQDKATASLIGDVPGGVMLDRPPVFLGGQGGLVGPVRIAYGTVIAAGKICRHDVTKEGLLVFGDHGGRQRIIPYNLRQYGDLDRIGLNNFIYVGNIHALAAWYRHARAPLTPGDPFAQACLAGALRQLDAMAAERASQLEKLAAKVAATPCSHPSHRRLLALRQRLPALLRLPPHSPEPPLALRSAMACATAPTFLETVTSLPEPARQAGTAWLQQIVGSVQRHWEEAPA
jgi:UDP-N-acetylglucosamine/UDP-N-acetylgalactosamine diphosphorylase